MNGSAFCTLTSSLRGDAPALWRSVPLETRVRTEVTMKYEITTLKDVFDKLPAERIKESLNNISIPSNRNLNFKNSALDFQDEAGFA